MEISHPRRILAVSYPDSGLLDLVNALTGSKPSIEGSIDGETIAGTTHNYSIKTTYYTATIPIWLDEITTPSTWSSEFLAPEAREVLTVLGAFVVCFRKPINEEELTSVKTLLENVAEVAKEGCGFSWDGVCLAIAMPQSTSPKLEKSFEEWEEVCQEFGFEYVDFDAKGRNEFSEPMGVERLREALEANDWEGAGGEDDDDVLGMEDFEVEDEFGEDEEGSLGFGIEGDMEEEMRGMKQAIYGGGGVDGEEGDEGEHDEEVEKLQAMMQKMQAVRDLGADMPEAERKRFAAKAVNEIMKTL